jgi:hypothetical protein
VSLSLLDEALLLVRNLHMLCGLKETSLVLTQYLWL